MKKSIFVLILLLCTLLAAIPAFANSAEPPGMIIIAPGIPEDAVITLEVPDGEMTDWRVQKTTKLWESQYRLYYHFNDGDISRARLRVTVGEASFTVVLPEGDYQGYKTVLTLDYKNQTLTLGQEPWRQPVLTAVRILLTLLTEGLIFWLFGFRRKLSWGIFFIVNLLTQGWLNITVNSYAFASGYWVFALVAMEAVIFIGESIAFPLALSEKKPWQRVVYALTANAVSLAVGLLLIGRLPL